MNSKFLRSLQLLLLVLDFFSLNVLSLFSQLGLHNINESFSLEYTRLWMYLNAFWFIVSCISNLYHEKYVISFEAFSRRTMHAYFCWLVLILGYVYFMHQYGLSRLFVIIVLSCQGIMLLINRFMYLGIRAYFKHQQYLVRRVIIIGYNETAKKLASYLEDESMYTNIIGFCEGEQKVHELSHYPILGSIDKAMEISMINNVSEIYCTITPEQGSGIYEIIKSADKACIRFRLVPDLSYFISHSFHIDYIKDIPVLTVRKEPLDDTGNKIKKRLFDIVVSTLVIVLVLTWLVPLLGLLIWLESPGPVFFKQLRSGKNNKPFYCFKLRSMVVNKEAHSKQATKNDSRLTKVGKLLRKTNLDEFPQFINVLNGDMSIVGPRPHMLKHTDDYSKIIDQYMIRQFLKPGITGWAQVNGFRGETKMLEQMQGRVEHDIWYLENWNLWLDLRIIFLTVFNILTGNKNAF